MKKCVVAFDLDDTLYKEKDFVISGYTAIANIISKKYPINKNQCIDLMTKGTNAFGSLINYLKEIGIYVEENIDWCLNIYRNHNPNITLDKYTENTLSKLYDKRIPLAIITDGRKISQTNKIYALGLNKFINFEQIFISEEIGYDKNHSTSFERLMNMYPEFLEFIYIGDNCNKDFFWPNRLGWKTICLKDNGSNIHSQNFDCDIEYRPQFIVNNISEILQLI